MKKNILIAVLVLALVGFAGYAFLLSSSDDAVEEIESEQNEQEENSDQGSDSKEDSTQEKSQDNSQNQTEVKASKAGWQVYANNITDPGYTIEYPEGWRIAETTYGDTEFGPVELGGEIYWSVGVEYPEVRTLQTIVSEIETEADREEITWYEEDVQIPAGKGIMISLFKINQDYTEQYVIIEAKGKIFILRQTPAAQQNYDFESFYRSLKIN